ncbi:phosphoribosylaminoimidazolesuccinocarboxamide synthase [Staphylospora marina]|uniref:phosphoribosylaminoimidazolesuccinocarboxamide synthase n=1 Tax=Staphylospora marina TaxID=2490858 RepID=UPI000F5C2860|nr:phosphoribosylaminoimidazolesuccinocarboxamide synthase [Staphylospora marina]
MKPGDLLYEGKAKQIFLTDDPELVRVKYKDSATAFNGEKKATLAGKGELNNRISAWFFRDLSEQGIPNHFVRMISPLEQLVKKVTIIPLEVVVRNVVAGSLSKRLGLSEGTPLESPVVEFYYKNDELGDPLLNEDHIFILKLAEPEMLRTIREMALKINERLTAVMKDKGIRLVDFKLEFGIDAQGNLVLADEISPDTCRFWDVSTGDRLDKDRFRRDLGDVVESYREIWNRLGGDRDV